MTLKSPIPVGLKKLKDIIGYKGERFAALVGIPHNTLRSVECGRLPMSRDQALKIRMATGVNADSLLKKTPKASHGEKYTMDDFHWWRTQYLSLEKDMPKARKDAAELGDSIGFWAKILLLAAVDRGEKVTFKSLHLEMAAVLEDIAERNNLCPAINRILQGYPLVKEHSPKKTKEWWLRDEPGPKSQRAIWDVSAKDLEGHGDEEEFQKSVTSPLEWYPQTVPAAVRGFHAATKTAR